MVTEAAKAEQGGTTTTLPLSDNARRGLQKNIRTGRAFLAVAILITAGVIAGIIAAGNAVFVVLLPAAGYLAWAYYYNAVQAARDLREGTLVRYTGPWRERTQIRGVHSSAQYRLYVQPPNLTQPVMIRRSALAKSARQAGIGDEWTSSGGQLEYTTRSHQPLTYSRHASAR